MLKVFKEYFAQRNGQSTPPALQQTTAPPDVNRVLNFEKEMEKWRERLTGCFEDEERDNVEMGENETLYENCVRR